MFKQSAKHAVAAILILAAGTSAARADACSGRTHTTGTVLGAVAGGLIGSQFGSGGGRAVATLGGVVLGGMAGNAIARDIDCRDRPYAERSYRSSFYGPVGQRYDWQHSDRHGYVMTTREYRRHDRICRDFIQVTHRHGREAKRNGTACRYRDGDWHVL